LAAIGNDKGDFGDSMTACMRARGFNVDNSEAIHVVANISGFRCK